jgi:hypothetical protein
MILGRSVISWIILAIVAVCVFILARWLIPLLFGVIGVAIPDQIVLVLSFLIALGVVWGGWSYRSGPVA